MAAIERTGSMEFQNTSKSSHYFPLRKRYIELCCRHLDMPTVIARNVVWIVFTHPRAIGAPRLLRGVFTDSLRAAEYADAMEAKYPPPDPQMLLEEYWLDSPEPLEEPPW